MNIIQVYQTNPFEEGQGGGVRYLKNLIYGINEKCDEILFFGIGEQHQKQNNIKLIPVTRKLTGYITFLVLLMIKLPFLNLTKYDVVHVHRLYFAIPFIIFKPKLKIVCSLHGRTFSIFESKYGRFFLKTVIIIFKKIELFCIDHIDYLVPVSQDVVNTFETKYPGFGIMNEAKMGIASPIVSHNDYSVFDETKSKLQLELDRQFTYLCFVGRLSDVKDIDFLFKLISSKKEYFAKRKIKLIIFGNGEKHAYLSKLVSILNINDYVIFYGEIPPQNVDLAIACSKMILISSKHESGPIVMKEALLCGIPVVSNNVGEVCDYIINHKNGFIVEKETKSYFKAINSLLENPISKEEVIKNSESQLKKCSVPYISSQFMKIYKNLIK